MAPAAVKRNVHLRVEPLRANTVDARVLGIGEGAHFVAEFPIHHDGQLLTLPMGLHLHQMFGADYRPLVATHTANSVPEMHVDGTGELGCTVAETPLPAPGSGSFEAGVLSVPTATTDDTVRF